MSPQRPPGDPAVERMYTRLTRCLIVVLRVEPHGTYQVQMVTTADQAGISRFSFITPLNMYEARKIC